MRQREPLYAEALLMVRGFGETYEEWARRTHVPTGTVKRRLNDAMRRLEKAGVVLKRQPGRGSRWSAATKEPQPGTSDLGCRVTADASDTGATVLRALRKL